MGQVAKVVGYVVIGLVALNVARSVADNISKTKAAVNN